MSDMRFVKIASAAEDVKVWEGATCALAETVIPHKSTISSISWSPDGQFLVSCPKAGGKPVISVLKPKLVASIELPLEVLQSHARFSNSTSHYIAACGADSDALIWDVRAQRVKKIIKSKVEGRLSCALFNEMDTHVACGGENGSVAFVNVTSDLSYAPILTPNVKSVLAMEFNQHCRMLLGTSTDDGSCCLYDCQAWKLSHCFFQQHLAPATDIAWSPVSELLLATVGLDRNIVTYDYRAKKSLHTKKTDHPLTAIDFTAEGCYLVVGNLSGGMAVYDLRSLVSPVITIAAHKSPVNAIRVLKSIVTSKMDLNINNALNKRSQAISPRKNCLGDKSVPPKGSRQQLPLTRPKMRTSVAPLTRTCSPAASGSPTSVVNVTVADVLSPLGMNNESVPLNDVPQMRSKVITKKTAQIISNNYPAFKAFVQPPSPTAMPPGSDVLLSIPLLSPLKKAVQDTNDLQTSATCVVTSKTEPVDTDFQQSSSSDCAQASTPNFPLELLKNTFTEIVEKYSDRAHADVVNLHVQMIKLVHRLQGEIDKVAEKQAINDELVKEICRLNEENRRLRFRF